MYRIDMRAILLMFMSPIRGNVRALHIGLGGIRKWMYRQIGEL